MSNDVFFVKVNGVVVKKACFLFAAQLACVCLNDSGISSSSLEIVDQNGVSYEKIGCH